MTAPRIKPLVWQNDMLFCGQPHAYADTPLGPWTVTAYDGRGGRWAYDDPSGDTSDMDWPTREEAQAAAQTDYETRILAALELQDATAVAGVEMPAGYTPGPWQVEEGTALVWGGGDADDQTSRGMGIPVAEAKGYEQRYWGRQIDWEERAANARLIALAPAMAEELVALRAENERLREALAFYANPEITDEQKREAMDALGRALDVAMYQTLAASIPACGAFGAIAQDLDFAFPILTAALTPPASQEGQADG